MRKALKIYAAVFAFLLTGVLGVGTAQAYDLETTDCGNGNIGYGGNCDGFNQPNDDGTVGNSSSTSSNQSAAAPQTQSYAQSQQSAPQAQTDQQAAPEPKKEQKPAATEQKADDSKQSATVAGSTDDSAPVVPLWALVTLSAGILGASSYALRRVTFSRSSYPEA